jgi:hypothetical protein
MRNILSTALVALIVGSLAGVTVSTLAQSEPSKDRAVTPAAKVANADKVDGKHAVNYTNLPGKRAKKLVATNWKGELPPNIVRPKWKSIQGKPASFADGEISWSEVTDKPTIPGGSVAWPDVTDKPAAFADGAIGWGEVQNKPGILADNQIGWGEVQNKPGILADNQIGWGEVKNKPAGFADGVDDRGVTGIKLIYVEVKRTLAPGKDFADIARCPAGSKVTGGGFYSGKVFGFEAIRSHPLNDLSGWAAGGRNPTNSDMPVSTTAVCMQITPSGALTTATK